jgi:hypothetical protein
VLGLRVRWRRLANRHDARLRRLGLRQQLHQFLDFADAILRLVDEVLNVRGGSGDRIVGVGPVGSRC